MFQFTAFASRSLCIQLRILHKEWVSPFGYRWIKARLPAPHRFSQATASFIACDRQGIHHMHLFARPYNECVSVDQRESKALTLAPSPKGQVPEGITGSHRHRLSIRVAPYSK